MPVESQIQSAVIDFARKNGWLVRRLEYTGRVGAPDIIAFRDGVTKLVEFKRPGGKLSPGQVAEHKLLTEHGIRVPVIDDIMDGYAIFR
jgi:hypothetical protein